MSELELPKRRPGRPRKLQIVSAISPGGMMPLDYMLAVLRDETVGTSRRDRMAIAAAPYCHERVGDSRLGKKEAAAIAVQHPDTGTALGELMARRQGLN